MSLPTAIVLACKRRWSVGGQTQQGETAVAKGKRTFQPNNRRRARVHGFRLRMRTRAGRAIVTGRRRKGRRSLTA
jgi:ribosomal protein L34